MLESIELLYDSDSMLCYTNPGKPPCRARALTLYYNRQLLVFQVVHASVDNMNQPSSGYTEHNHNDYFHLVLFTGTGGSFSYKGCEYTAEKGQLLLISPGEEHSFETRGGASLYSEVTFTLHPDGKGEAVNLLDYRGLFHSFAGREVLDCPVPLGLSESGREEMVLYFNLLLQGLKRNGPAGEFLWQQALGSMFSFLCREYFLSDELHSLSQGTSHFEKARLYIEMHFSRAISAGTLAEIAGVSRGHFFRKFKNLYGVTFTRYQRLLRINASRNLLKIGDQPNHVIAEQLGFSDVYHFAHTFKKETAMTPGEYRKSHKSSMNSPSFRNGN